MRAQSETLGFVLIFALILLSVGLVTTLGVSELQQIRVEEQTNNVERAFDVLDSNIEDLHRRGAPSRATEIRLAGGDIRTGDDVSIEINATNTTDVADNESFVMTTHPIVYDSGEGSEILYVNGAVLRSDRGNTAMLSEPGWLASSNRTLVPFVVTYNDGAKRALSGEGTGLLVLQRSSPSVNSFTTGPGSTARVNISVESPRASAWKRYFEDRGFIALDPSTDDGTVVYQFRTDEIHVPRTDVAVTFRR